jgi:hypothetical protein
MKKTPKNFAIWTALNSDIRFFSSGPSYYGGANRTKEEIEQAKYFCEKYHIEKKWSYFDDIEILKQIKVIGIDFDKSSLPESDQVSKFEGTFADSSSLDIVTGVLVLKDGQRIDYYAECKLNMDQFKAMQEFFEAAE